MQLKLEYTLQRLIRKWGTQKLTLKCHYCNAEYWIETERMLSSQLWHIDEINGDKKKVPIKCKSARLIAWFFQILNWAMWKWIRKSCDCIMA